MKTITINKVEEGFPKAAELVEEALVRKKISRVMHNETMMLFEAVYHNLQEQLQGSNTQITISAQKRLGDLKIIIGYEGGMMDPTESSDEFSPETRILEAYNDKIDYSYRFGHNKIDITVRKSFQLTQIIYLLAVLTALAVYIPIRLYMNMEIRQDLLDQVVFPIEQLFANAMVMIAAPVTFFSLLKNRTNAYIVAEWNDNVRRLHSSAFGSSIVAVLLAIVAGLIANWVFRGSNGLLAKYSDLTINTSFSDMLSGLMPSNIFEPFITISPFPLIILTFMVTYALFSAGKHFDLINQLINAFYKVISTMLSMIMMTMPFFLFTAILDLLLRRGFSVLWNLVQLFIIVMISLSLLWLFYGIRLKRVGIPPLRFLNKLMELLRENFVINSAIDAAPYNVRWCVHNLKLNRKRLHESVPIMAQINLDGNCFLITLTALLFISFSSTEVTVLNIIGIAVLVLFLSMGAPNQPGSCLIGILIIFYHMNAFSLIPLAIFTEAMIGGVQNLVNVAGDIVTIAVDEASNGAEINLKTKKRKKR